MRVMSTLKTVCTCGLVCLDSTILFAIMLRILVIGTSSPGSGAGFGAAEGAGTAANFVAGFSMWSRMSCLVMRPAEPVPGTCARSTLLSLAILRTSGDDRNRSPAKAAAELCAGAAGALAAGGGAAASAACAAFAGAGAAAALPAAPPITATTVLIPTVAPSCTLISVSVPATGDG